MKMEWWVIASSYVRSKMPRRNPQKGQGLVEYSLILAFIAMIVYISLKFVQPSISTSLNNVANGF